MTEMQTTPVRSTPRWDLADRLRKALREADLGVEEMAEYLEVSRNTVGSWINGRTKPRSMYVRVFAARTGVAYEWLAHGRNPAGENDAPAPGLEPGTLWFHDQELAPTTKELVSARKNLRDALRGRDPNVIFRPVDDVSPSR